jgi:hypothetical protein
MTLVIFFHSFLFISGKKAEGRKGGEEWEGGFEGWEPVEKRQ